MPFDPNQPIDRSAVRFPEPVEDAEEIVNAPIFDPNQPIDRDAVRFPEPVENPEEIINAPRPLAPSDDSVKVRITDAVSQGIITPQDQNRYISDYNEQRQRAINEAAAYYDEMSGKLGDDESLQLSKDEYLAQFISEFDANNSPDNLEITYSKKELELSKAIERLIEAEGDKEGYVISDIIKKGTVSESDLVAIFGREEVDNALNTISALDQLEKYKTADGYNLVAAKLDNVPESVVVAAGFEAKDYQESDIFKGRTPTYNEFLAYYGSVYGKGADALGVKQKDAIYNEYIERYGFGNWVKGTLLEAKDFTADMLVPLYWTRNAEGMSPGEVALNLAMDALLVIPVVKAGAEIAGKTGAKGIVKIAGINPALQSKLNATLQLNEFAEAGLSQTKQLSKTLDVIYSPIKVNGKSTTIGKLQNKAVEAKIRYMSDLVRASNVSSVPSKEVIESALKIGDKKLLNQLRKIERINEQVAKSEKSYYNAVNRFADALGTVKTKRITRIGGGPSKVGGKNVLFDDPALARSLQNMPVEAVKSAKYEVQEMLKVKQSSAAEIRNLEKQVSKAQQKFDDLQNSPQRLERGFSVADAAAELNQLKRRLALAKAGGIEALQTNLVRLRELRSSIKKGAKLPKGKTLRSIEEDIAKTEAQLSKEYRSLLAEYESNPPSRGGGTAVKTRQKPLTGGSQKTFELTKPIERGLILGDARALVAARPKVVSRPIHIAQPSRRQIQSPSTDELSLVDNMMAEMGEIGIESNPIDETASESATESEIETELKTGTEVKTQTDELTRVEDKIKTDKPIGTVRPPINRIKRRFKPETGEIEKTAEGFDPRGTIAWYSGMVGHDSVWYVAKYPYETEDDLTAYIGVLPPGVTPVEGGEGAALRSLQLITGKPPEQLRIDLGVQDITLRGKSISFTQDREQKTRGDITVRKGRIKVVRLDKYV